MNILVVGGDGFCGWPTSLELLSNGHSVTIIDNLLRRKIDENFSTNSLTEIASLDQRVKTANTFFDDRLKFEILDVAKEYNKLVNIIIKNNIDTIVHFGEIRAAPYSMVDSVRSRETIDNNINATSNILNAIAYEKRDIHLVHLGTMGVYGYKDDFGKIPEGYLDINVKSTNADTQILFPTDPGSVYHMTKSLDQIMFQFYCKNWKLKITDLHQGIIWGTQTRNTKLHPDLVNRFDYDGLYGTVLNRFIVESVANYPLTVHGTGGQKRAFIHIQDCADCVTRAVENIPTSEKVRIFNQVAEVKGVLELAKMIQDKTNVEINFQENPRNERAENELEVENQGLQSLGFKPTLLDDGLVDDIFFITENVKKNINTSVIDATKYKWVK